MPTMPPDSLMPCAPLTTAGPGGSAVTIPFCQMHHCALVRVASPLPPTTWPRLFRTPAILRTPAEASPARGLSSMTVYFGGLGCGGPAVALLSPKANRMDAAQTAGPRAALRLFTLFFICPFLSRSGEKHPSFVVCFVVSLLPHSFADSEGVRLRTLGALKRIAEV